jgi:hypothetical protein
MSLTRRVRGCMGMVEFIKAIADVVRPVNIDGRSIMTASREVRHANGYRNLGAPSFIMKRF